MFTDYLWSEGLTLPIVCFFITTVVYFLFTRKRSTDKALENVPGPPQLPIFGNALHFIGSLDETLPKVVAWCENYGHRVKSKFGMDYFVFMWGVDDLEKLLSSKEHTEKGGDYEFLKPWLGSGLLTSKGAKWTASRKMLTPSFHFKILDQFIDVINEQSLKMVDILRNEFTPKESFDITPFVKRCTLDIICETAMGKQINSQEKRETPYLKAIHRIGELFQIRSLSPWFEKDFVWNLTSYAKEEKGLLATAHGFTEGVIKERKLQRSKNKSAKPSEREADNDMGVKKKLAFLDLILETQENPENEMSDEDVRQQTDTFMFGGHDTTASNIGFTLFLFGSYPKIQAKVQEELDAIFGDDRTRPVTAADFTQMKYMECCLKESLRLYPSAPMITRRLTSDLKLGDGVVIPAGVTIIPTIFQLHRDPKHFPNPEKFDPDRFSAENVSSGRHPYAYIPFSAGPRNCIGQKFAVLEEKVIIANMLRNFKITAEEKPEELKLLAELTLSSKTGIRLFLEPR